MRLKTAGVVRAGMLACLAGIVAASRGRAATLASQFETGRTWHVSAHAVTGGDGSEASPFGSVGDAVRAASADDTVRIGRGEYAAGVTAHEIGGQTTLSRVVVDKRLRLVGAGRGKTVIRGASAEAPDADGCGAAAVRGILFAEGADGSLVEGLTVAGGRTVAADLLQTTSDEAVWPFVTTASGDKTRLAQTGANLVARGGGMLFLGNAGARICLVDVTVEDCRAGYAGGALEGPFALVRTMVDRCRAGVQQGGAVRGVLGAFSSLFVACGGKADQSFSLTDTVIGADLSRVVNFVNCTMAVNYGNGVNTKMLGDVNSPDYTGKVGFYNCVFFDASSMFRFVDNQGLSIWNSAMNANGSMPNGKRNIGGDWGAKHPAERHLQGGNNNYDFDANKEDPSARIDAFGWAQLVSPYTDFRLRAGSALVGQGSNEWIAVACAGVIPDEYLDRDFAGAPRRQGECVDMGAFEGGVEPGRRYRFSDGGAAYRLNGRRVRMKDSRGTDHVSGALGARVLVETLLNEGEALYAYATDTPGETVNGHATSYRYLYPDGMTGVAELYVEPDGTTEALYTIQRAASVVWADAEAGDDGNPGTRENPVRTLQKANDISSENGVIFAKAGVYAEGEGDAMTDADWIRSTKCRVTLSRNVRLCAVEGAEKTVIRGRFSTDQEGFVNSGCGAGALRCVGVSGDRYVAIQGFTITGGATDSDPDGKSYPYQFARHDANPACSIKSADDWQAYNWAAAGICGRSWEGWRQQHVQAIDCIISNNVAYRHAALANVLARRCVITRNRTVDPSLETNKVFVYQGTTYKSAGIRCHGTLAYASSLSQCLVCDNEDVDGSLVVSGKAVYLDPAANSRVVQTTFRDSRSGRRVVEGGNVYNCVFKACPQPGIPDGTSGGNAVDPLLLDDFSVPASSEAADCGVVNGNVLAVALSSLDGSAPRYEDGPVTAGAFARLGLGFKAAANGGRGIEPAGSFAANPGETVSFEATDAATRNFLGFDVNGTFVPRDTCGTSYSWTPRDGDNVLFTLTAVYATNWYVNADAAVGDDAKDGWSEGTPKRTLAGVMAHAVPGDVVHAAPGDYNEGFMRHETPILQRSTNEVEHASRVVVPPGVALVADEGPSATFITGVRDSVPRKSLNGYWGAYFKLGPDAMRCVTLCEDARLEGFTLREGGTDDTDRADDASAGSGVLAAETSLVRDCVITGCHGFVGTGFGGTYVRCRFDGNLALSKGGAAASARLFSCYADRCSDVPFADCADIRNCTVGPNCEIVFVFSGYLLGSVFNENCRGIRNCLILSPTRSGAQVKAYKDSSDNVILDAAGSVGFDEATSSNNLRFAAAELPVDDDGRLLPGNKAIDAGCDDWLAEDRLTATDCGGGARVYNGRVDAGAYEFDWRPAFGKTLRPRKLQVLEASPDAVLADGGLLLREGSVTCEWNGTPGGWRRRFANFRVTGGGVLQVAVEGVPSLSFSAADGDVRLPVETAIPNRLTFAYAKAGADGEDVGVAFSPFEDETGFLFLVR